ncbi:hypothetical protein DID77_04490 [Candidatus Marinamargulisbacteria bacterium SCGC AG-439-L15]|nr:hypothetical protein DID77_04490 [Candidatus Marinamargulisbacteria bacterium SCGC AG-439-L15]
MKRAIKRFMFKRFKGLVQGLVLIQRIPLVLGYVLGLSVCYVIYKLTGYHRLLVTYSKVWLRYFFFINGIRLTWDKEAIDEIEGQVICANYFGPIDYAILFLILPYKKLLLMKKTFFDGGLLKKWLYLLGFYPVETDFDSHTYQSKQFRVEPYAKVGFNLVECVHVRRQDVEPVPYSIMVAVKMGLPICFLQIKGSEWSKMATFFTPKKVDVQISQELAPNKRPEMTLLKYRQQLEAYRPYEKARRQQIRLR